MGDEDASCRVGKGWTLALMQPYVDAREMWAWSAGTSAENEDDNVVVDAALKNPSRVVLVVDDPLAVAVAVERRKYGSQALGVLATLTRLPTFHPRLVRVVRVETLDKDLRALRDVVDLFSTAVAVNASVGFVGDTGVSRVTGVTLPRRPPRAGRLVGLGPTVPLDKQACAHYLADAACLGYSDIACWDSFGD